MAGALLVGLGIFSLYLWWMVGFHLTADGWPAEDAVIWPLYAVRYVVRGTWWLTRDAFRFLLRVGSRAWAVVRGR